MNDDFNKQSGQELTDYIIICSMVGIASIAAYQYFNNVKKIADKTTQPAANITVPANEYISGNKTYNVGNCKIYHAESTMICQLSPVAAPK